MVSILFTFIKTLLIRDCCYIAYSDSLIFLLSSQLCFSPDYGSYILLGPLNILLGSRYECGAEVLFGPTDTSMQTSLNPHRFVFKLRHDID